MDLGPLRQLALELNFDAHGVTAVVTRPGEDAVTTTGIWQRPLLEDLPVGREFAAREPRRIMALRRDVLEEVERGTTVAAAETIGGTSQDWQIDGIETVESDYYLVRLIAETSA